MRKRSVILRSLLMFVAGALAVGVHHGEPVRAEDFPSVEHGRYVTPVVPSGLTSAWAQYSILSPHREADILRLQKAGIPTAIYYPIPLHLQRAFDSLGHKAGDFPVSEKVAAEIFSLPMHPYLPDDQIDRIVGILMAG